MKPVLKRHRQAESIISTQYVYFGVIAIEYKLEHIAVIGHNYGRRETVYTVTSGNMLIWNDRIFK